MFGNPKPFITVHLKVAGFMDRKMITAELDLPVPEGSTVKQMFSLADKSGKLPRKVMKNMLGALRPPTVLLNGRGLDVPSELSQQLNPGDDIAVMTPMAGG
jgi:molybdopterin converting factor small subunit